jgi:oligopeptide transport system substrate-binding protein
LKKYFCLILILFSLSFTVFADSTDNILRFYLGDTDLELDPHKAMNTTEAQLFTALYEGLVSYHPSTMKPLPGLASWWKVSDDNLTWSFYIRENARYSNGSSLTAADVRDSWLKALSPDRGSYFSSMLDIIVGAADFRSGKTDRDSVKIEAIDERELKVTLTEPAPYFLSILCHFSFAPVHPVMYGIDDWSQVISIPVTGPYRIKSHEKDKLVLEPNPYYWDLQSIDIETIEVTTHRDTYSVMQKFNRFELDWIMSGYNTNMLTNRNGMILSPLFGTSYFYFSNREEPWDNPLVRRALALLLPWQNIYSQQLIPAHTLVPPIGDYPSPGNPLTYNEEEAYGLLEEAGYPMGEGLPEIVVRITSALWGDPVPMFMKQFWEEKLKTTVRIETIPSEVYYDSLREPGYTLGHLSWAGDYADPMTFLQMWQSSSSFNDALYNSKEYDKLLRESAQTTAEERFAKLSMAEKHLLESGEVLPLAHFPAIHMLDLRFLGGWYNNALDIHPFKYLFWKNDAPIPNTL